MDVDEPHDADNDDAEDNPLQSAADPGSRCEVQAGSEDGHDSPDTSSDHSSALTPNPNPNPLFRLHLPPASLPAYNPHCCACVPLGNPPLTRAIPPPHTQPCPPRARSHSEPRPAISLSSSVPHKYSSPLCPTCSRDDPRALPDSHRACRGGRVQGDRVAGRAWPHWAQAYAGADWLGRARAWWVSVGYEHMQSWDCDPRAAKKGRKTACDWLCTMVISR
ncbi:hypothetical protein JB92DRAFT_1997381 [Gautieria morchelliformis]|nr:hypothetical protein JB92DRAFT_1997381 [Gautieria morchelliformis]